MKLAAELALTELVGQLESKVEKVEQMLLDVEHMMIVLSSTGARPTVYRGMWSALMMRVH